MKSFIALALVGAVSALDNTTFKFMQFLSKQNKSYASLEEFNLRLQNFANTDEFIEKWNANKENTSTVGHNFLSDWTPEEKKRLNGYGGERPVPAEALLHTMDENQTVPASVNWVTAGNVGAVQDQGQCGSCWAFSATGAAAASLSIQYNAAPTYNSQQQLVSCSSSFGNQGCNGGWYFYAWNYMQTTAQVSAATYPYTSGKFGVTGTCNTAALTPGVVKTQSPTAYYYAGRSNSMIQSAIVIKPNSVAIEADQPVF
jgi:cathepsin L